MTNQSTTMFIDIRPGEVLDLDGIVTVELVQKSGQFARLRIHAPLVVSIQKKNADAENSRGKDARVTTS